MAYCRIHGQFDESDGGCSECQEWQSRLEENQNELREELSHLAWKTTNPGDYECPHCRFTSLRRLATRCPTCHGAVGDDYWQPIREREERAAAKALSEAKERAERDARVAAEQAAHRLAEQEAEHRAATTAAALTVLLVALGILVGGGYYLRHLPARVLDGPGVTLATQLQFDGPATRRTVNDVASDTLSLELTQDNPMCATGTEPTCSIWLYSGGRPNSGWSMRSFSDEFALVIDEVDVWFELVRTRDGRVLSRSERFDAGATPGYHHVIVADRVSPGRYLVIVHTAGRGRYSILWTRPLGD